MIDRFLATRLRALIAGALLASLCVMTFVTPSHAQADPVALLRDLAVGGFDDKANAVDALAASAHPKAAEILEALVAGKLFVREDGTVVLGRGPDGEEKFFDPLTGEASEGAASEKVRVNNNLRRRIRAAAARIGLLAEDPAARESAAHAAFRSPDADALPLIEEAIAKETVPRIKTLLEQAKAVVVISQDDASVEDKVTAVTTIADRGDKDARAAIAPFLSSDIPALHDAAEKAVSAIDNQLLYWTAAQNAWYGLSLGSVLLLAAIGLAITMGVMGVINMAHGEMVMLGAYTTYVVQNFVQASMPELSSLSLALAVPAAFLVAGAVGILIERTVIRFLYGRPLETLLATWGLSLVLQQTVRSIFGPTNKSVVSPPWMSGAFDVGYLTITYNRLWIIVFSLTVFAVLLLVLKYTRFGLQTRAVTQNRPMASAMGIRTDRIDALTFGLGSGIAGIAGVALSQLDNVSPNLGQSYIIDSFMVVVFGGVGNLWGTLVGSMTLGVANKFLEPYAGAVLGKIFVLVFIILFIQRRPRGLFALKGRSVEG